MNSDHNHTSEQLRQVMRLLPYPVTVVTALAGENRRGITIGSFTSVSMEPPLISFNISRESRMHTLFEEAESFVVHIPGIDQQKLCERFALSEQSEEQQFRGLDFSETEGGLPVLDGMIAELFCRVYKRVRAGDHTIIIGEVQRVNRNREDISILYYDGSYQLLHPDDQN